MKVITVRIAWSDDDLNDGEDSDEDDDDDDDDDDFYVLNVLNYYWIHNFNSDWVNIVLKFIILYFVAHKLKLRNHGIHVLKLS